MAKRESKQLWGMVHVGALPGTPSYQNDFERIVSKAVEEAKLLEKSGFTGVLFENMHDVPYLKGKVGSEITAAMAVIGHEIRKEVSVSVGLQILAGANEAALSVAHAIGADWIRVEGFVFAHIADEGQIEACAGELLRLRRSLGAQKIKIMADIKKKHSSHAITQDISLSETAKAADFFGADAVIITGKSTGEAPLPEDLISISKKLSIPVFMGSGITSKNMKDYSRADGFIVGSSLKEKGDWKKAIDHDAARQIYKIFKSL